MHALAAIVESVCFLILVLMIFGGANFRKEVFQALERFQQHRLEKMRNEYRLKILAERKAIAVAQEDPIKLLIADDALGEDFNRRLRNALDEQRKKAPKELAATRDDVIDDAFDARPPEVAEEEIPERKRKTSRRSR